MKPRDWMNFFEKVGDIYHRLYLNPLWKKYHHGANVGQSLSIFLSGYAFERQGRNPSYAHAAVDAIEECNVKDNLNKDIEKAIRKKFSDKLDNKRLNKDHNPLYQTGVNKKSVVGRLLNGGSPNLIKRVGNYFNNDDIDGAFGFLESIRGIGPKISSFFLRDFKEALKIDGDKIFNLSRYRLQPIDLWVRRVIRQLNNSQGMDDRSIAEFIVKHSKNPEKVNMGIWIFAALICGSHYKLIKSLHNLERAKQEVNNYLKKNRGICDIRF